MKKLKFPSKCEHCNAELVCCEEQPVFTKDSHIIEARKCPECERMYYMGYTDFTSGMRT